MKTFKMDQNGDVIIKNNRIEMISGADVVIQTLKQVLNTNLKEWFADEEEGIDHSVILTKNPNKDLIRDTINTAVYKVADQLGVELETNNFSFSTKDRELTITFEITLGTGENETVSVTL
uniref:hypothetical protein n=1 Tax=Acetatifactor sp. TaxID=1872090 RepID=UPI0040578B40